MTTVAIDFVGDQSLRPDYDLLGDECSGFQLQSTPLQRPAKGNGHGSVHEKGGSDNDMELAPLLVEQQQQRQPQEPGSEGGVGFLAHVQDSDLLQLLEDVCLQELATKVRFASWHCCLLNDVLL